MKFAMRALLQRIPLLLIVSLASTSIADVRGHATAFQEGSVPLTNAERRYVVANLAQAVTWFSHWYRPTSCPRDVNRRGSEWETAASSGKDVKVVLEISNRNIHAIVDQLNVNITYRRAKEVPHPLYREVHCADSYEAYSRRRSRGRRRKTPEENAQEIKTAFSQDFEIAEPDVIQSREQLRVNLPEMRYKVREPAQGTEAVANNLLRKAILDEIAKNSGFSCEPGGQMEVWIPEFSQHDPGVVVAIRERQGYRTANGFSIGFFYFGCTRAGSAPVIAAIRRQTKENEVFYYLGKIVTDRLVVEKVDCARR